MKLVWLILIVLVMPVVLASTPITNTGVGIRVNTSTTDLYVTMHPDSRTVWHNAADNCSELIEREENYAFTGEQIEWNVFVRDGHGVEKISDVYVTVGSNQGIGNNIEANCDENREWTDAGIPPPGFQNCAESCEFVFNPNTDRWYTCKLTVEPNMHGEYWIVAEAEDISGYQATFDENEFWFFNPAISISVVGSIDFGTLKPGERGYSDTLRIVNNAETGSGVMLNMWISGEDFYDSSHSGAKCPTSNVLRLNAYNDGVCSELDNFCYYATLGRYDTTWNTGSDTEAYDEIPYETGDPDDRAEIIEDHSALSPGADISITFRLDMPEPCNGDFDSGQIYFWGEAI